MKCKECEAYGEYGCRAGLSSYVIDGALGCREADRLMDAYHFNQVKDDTTASTHTNMRGIYIPGVEMPKTGVYEISIGNTNDRDKPVVTVYKRNDDGFIHVFGSYELVPVPPHGRLIDAAVLDDVIRAECDECGFDNYGFTGHHVWSLVDDAPTIIPADETGV